MKNLEEYEWFSPAMKITDVLLLYIEERLKELGIKPKPHDYCTCIGWQMHVSPENCLDIYGERVRYCPWCGTKIVYEEK